MSYPYCKCDHCLLIHAAPDMLAALRQFDEYAWTAIKSFDCDEAREGLQSRIDTARAAIAKATIPPPA